MKQIDDNQLTVINYLCDQITGTYEDLLPLIEYSDDQKDAYLAVMAKLKIAGIIDTQRKNGNIIYSLTNYGTNHFK